MSTFVKRTDVRTLGVALAMAAGAAVLAVEPAFACHDSTGWCCMNGDYDTGDGDPDYCCFFNDDELIEVSCGWY